MYIIFILIKATCCKSEHGLTHSQYFIFYSILSLSYLYKPSLYEINLISINYESNELPAR